MNAILGVFAACMLLSGAITSSGVVFAQSASSEKACQDAIEARKQIEILDKKYATLKQKAYADWEQQNKSGQYSGTWEEYSQKFLDSQEIKDIQTMRQKYAEIDQKCVQYGPIKSESESSKKKECTTTDYENIKKIFFMIEEKLVSAKNRYYKEWESLSKSGKYSDTWDKYAKENLYTSQEWVEYQKAQEKYGAIIQYCQSEQQILQKPNMAAKPDGCNDSDLENAKKALSESDQKVTALKNRLYAEWKLQRDAGKINDGWDIYMKQHFDGAAEVKEWRQTQEKFSNVIHICTPTNAEIVRPNESVSLKQSNEKAVKPSMIMPEKKTKTTDKYDKLTKAKKIKKAKKSTLIVSQKSGTLIQE